MDKLSTDSRAGHPYPRPSSHTRTHIRYLLWVESHTHIRYPWITDTHGYIRLPATTQERWRMGAPTVAAWGARKSGEGLRRVGSGCTSGGGPASGGEVPASVVVHEEGPTDGGRALDHWWI
jgi:hypothetical protein